MAMSPIPEGYHSVTPYLVVPDVGRLIDFLKAAFGAEQVGPLSHRPDGSIMHAVVQIGDSRIMMGGATAEHPPMPCMLYVYVPDVDATYKQAMQAGATSLQEPADQFYGDRNAGVQDANGLQWWIGTHKEDVTPEQMEERHKAAQGHA